MEKKIISLIFTLISYSFCQDYIDVIYLENGSIIKGTIVNKDTSYPDQIMIETSDGSIFVYEMSEVVTISQIMVEDSIPKKEEKNNPPENSFKNQKLWSSNFTGLLIGGVSSLTWEEYSNNKSVEFTRYNLWTYRNPDFYCDIYYDDCEHYQIGLGSGTGIKRYFSNTKPFSGLSLSFSADYVFIYNHEIYSDYWGEDDFSQVSLAFALTGGFGISIPIKKVRLEPLISIGYVLIIDEEEVTHGFLATPQINIGFLL